MAQSPKTSQGRASLSGKVWLPSMKTVQPVRSQPPAWQWRWMQSPMPSAGLPQEVTVEARMPSSFQIQWACYRRWKVEWEAQTGICQIVDIYPWTLLWVYCPGHAGVKGNDRSDRRVGKQPSQVACFSENLKCCARDTTCRRAGTKSRTSRHRSPGEERRRKKKR